MKEKLQIRIRKTITNMGGQTIHKNELVTINDVWSNCSNTILRCEIQKDDIIIITNLKDIL